MYLLKNLVTDAIKQCKESKIDNYNLSIFVLLEYSCQKTKLDYVVQPDSKIPKPQAKLFNEYIKQLISGVPLYRIINERDFFGLKLQLTPETLEPRFDTEIIVELAISYISNLLKNQEAINFLDIGIGSGAISLAILNHFRNYNVTAVGVDIQPSCVKTAKINSVKHNLDKKIEIFTSDCFASVNDKFDIIISNPPYIPTMDIENLQDNVKLYDPITALDGGQDGLEFYKIIAKQSQNYLQNSKIVILEIGYDQKKKVTDLFLQNNYIALKSLKDYNNLDRTLSFTLNPEMATQLI